MSIVIVDDSPTNLIILRQLAKKHYQQSILTFNKPEDARDHLAHNTASIVILDCEMPSLDGISLTRAIRGIPHHRGTPIVMVTNHAGGDIKQNALAAGVTEFLSKPVDASEFRVRIRNLLRLVTQPEAANLS